MCKEAGPVAQVVIQHINKYTFFGEGNINLRRKGAEWQTDLLKHERYLWDLYKIRPNFSISPKTWRTCMTIVWAERHIDWFSTQPPAETRQSWIKSTAAYNQALCRQAAQVQVKKTKWAAKKLPWCAAGLSRQTSSGTIGDTATDDEEDDQDEDEDVLLEDEDSGAVDDLQIDGLSSALETELFGESPGSPAAADGANSAPSSMRAGMFPACPWIACYDNELCKAFRATQEEIDNPPDPWTPDFATRLYVPEGAGPKDRAVAQWPDGFEAEITQVYCEELEPSRFQPPAQALAAAGAAMSQPPAQAPAPAPAPDDTVDDTVPEDTVPAEFAPSPAPAPRAPATAPTPAPETAPQPAPAPAAAAALTAAPAGAPVAAPAGAPVATPARAPVAAPAGGGRKEQNDAVAERLNGTQLLCMTDPSGAKLRLHISTDSTRPFR